MLSVILLVIIAIFFGFFSTQNATPTSLTFGDQVIADVPLYIVLGVTLLVGLLYAWLVSLVTSMQVKKDLRDKDRSLTDVRRENDSLNKRVVDLEMENTRLRALIDKPEKE